MQKMIDEIIGYCGQFDFVMLECFCAPRRCHCDTIKNHCDGILQEDEFILANVPCPICCEESPDAMGCGCFNDIHYGKD
jgi:hypothetical protein